MTQLASEMRALHAERRDLRSVSADHFDSGLRQFQLGLASLPHDDLTAVENAQTAIAAARDTLDAARQHQAHDDDQQLDEEWETSEREFE